DSTNPERDESGASGPPVPERMGDDDALMVDSTNPERDESGASGPPAPEHMGDDDAPMVESANPKHDELGAPRPPAPKHMGDNNAPMVESTNPERDELDAPRPPAPEHIGDDNAPMVESANPERDKLGAPGPPAPEHLGNRPTRDTAQDHEEDDLASRADTAHRLLDMLQSKEQREKPQPTPIPDVQPTPAPIIQSTTNTTKTNVSQTKSHRNRHVKDRCAYARVMSNTNIQAVASLARYNKQNPHNEVQNNTSPVRAFFQYTLTQHLMQIDPVLFIIQHYLRPFFHKENALDPHTMAIPLPAIYAHPQTVSLSIWMYDPNWDGEDTYCTSLYGVVPIINQNSASMQYHTIPFRTSRAVALQFAKKCKELNNPLEFAPVPVRVNPNITIKVHQSQTQIFPVTEATVSTLSAVIWDRCIPITPYSKPHGHENEQILAYQVYFTHPEYKDTIRYPQLEKARANCHPLYTNTNRQAAQFIEIPDYYRLSYLTPLSGIDNLGRAILAQQP
ncbi:hypothetical protein UA08_06880B, partial [Talaromyces atroroseus]